MDLVITIFLYGIVVIFEGLCKLGQPKQKISTRNIDGFGNGAAYFFSMGGDDSFKFNDNEDKSPINEDWDNGPNW